MYASDGDFVHDWFHFDMTDTEREAFNKLGIPFGEPILVDEPSVLSEYIRMMAIEFNSGGAHSEEIIVNLMRSFFFKLSDQIRSQRDVGSEERSQYFHAFNELRSAIRNFPYQDWSLEKAANAVNMSKTWFEYNYKKLFVTSFREDLISSRIEYAKRVLLQTNDSIANIADICGYKSDIYFMRQFKNKTGFTPTEYRNQCRKVSSCVGDIVRKDEYKMICENKNGKGQLYLRKGIAAHIL